MTVTIPREIIKWIQSEDLSFPAKNYKKDFANGYLLLEILSHYYPSDVIRTTMDNGTGPNSRKNNWHVLERIFTVNIN